MSKLIYFARVTENGDLKIPRRHEFYEELKRFSGKSIILTADVKRKSRSLMQNAYYHAIVVQYIRDGLIEAGYKVNQIETHEFLKSKFLKTDLVNEQTGEVLTMTGSTTKLTTTQMMDYIAEIQQWAAEFLGVTIPDPEQQIELEMEDKNE